MQDVAIQKKADDLFDIGAFSKVKNARVIVVVPTYNEAANLQDLAEQLFGLGLTDLRIIIVDDGSPDGTGEVAKQLSKTHNNRIELIQRGAKMGLGSAYIEGFKKALADGTDYVVQMDADLSHRPEYVSKFLVRLKDADVVVGSRYVEQGGVDEKWGLLRRIISTGGNLGIRTITGLRVKDATSGFKAYRAEALACLDLDQFKCKGFGFQAEVAYACQRKGYRIVEYPITFDERFRGKSKMSFAIMLEAFRRLLILRFVKK